MVNQPYGHQPYCLVSPWRVNFLMTIRVATWAQGAGIQFLLFPSHRCICSVHVLSLLPCLPSLILAIWVLVLSQCNAPGQGFREGGLDYIKKDRAYTSPFSPYPSLLPVLSPSPAVSSFPIIIFEWLVGIGETQESRRVRNLGLVGLSVFQTKYFYQIMSVLRCPECWRVSCYFIPLLPSTYMVVGRDQSLPICSLANFFQPRCECYLKTCLQSRLQREGALTTYGSTEHCYVYLLAFLNLYRVSAMY